MPLNIVDSGCWSSCHWLLVGLDHFILDRRPHRERAVTSLPIVEDLEVLEDRDAQLHAGPPLLAVQQLGLHPTQKDSMTALS